MPNQTALIENGPLIDPVDLEGLLGWQHKVEGLCRDNACVIVPPTAELIVDGRLDVTVAAELLDRPAVVDTESGVTAIGAPRRHRRSALSDLVAPDFVLPDLDGTPHALSDHRSKKRLLVAFSSW